MLAAESKPGEKDQTLSIRRKPGKHNEHKSCQRRNATTSNGKAVVPCTMAQPFGDVSACCSFHPHQHSLSHQSRSRASRCNFAFARSVQRYPRLGRLDADLADDVDHVSAVGRPALAGASATCRFHGSDHPRGQDLRLHEQCPTRAMGNQRAITIVEFVFLLLNVLGLVVTTRLPK